MTLIIDAYNVLKQLSSAQHISQIQRDAFVRKLSSYAERKGHRIIIVFDGGTSKHPHRLRESGVEVIYAGYAMSADEVIKHLCDTLRNEQVAVISSDRSLCAYVSYSNIACIDAHLLQDLIQHADKQEPLRLVKAEEKARKRTGHVSSSELDELMHAGSEQLLIKSEDEEYAEQKKRLVNRTKLSKTEKKLKKLVNKL